ncbi:MAG: hypothetical protein V3V19_09675 [Cocleimonas sp.]
MNSFNFTQSFKAVLTGALFMLIASLLMKIAYIFLAATYHNLSTHFPFLSNVSGSILNFITIPMFAAIMFAGGYITAGVARRKTILHSFIVGLLTASIMMIIALQTPAGVTKTNIVSYIVILLATTAGGYYWKRRATRTS